jgi:hypothetical protein
MKNVPSDVRERNRFVERSLDDTLQALGQRDIQVALGYHAVEFAGMISSAVVANYSDGEVTLPASYDRDTEPVPIVAVPDGAQITFSPEFYGQTSEQRDNTVEVFQSWRPIGRTAAAVYDDFFPTKVPLRPDAYVLPQMSLAMNLSVASLMGSRWLGSHFASPPEKGVAMIRHRPAIFLKMRAGQKAVTPDNILHEFTHYRQWQNRPVAIVHSQRSLDMAMLRDELEAYHFGAAVAISRYIENSKRDPAAAEATPGSTQVHVELTRRECAMVPGDPFMPSGHLWKTLQERGLGHILHMSTDYTAIEQSVGEEDIALTTVGDDC